MKSLAIIPLTTLVVFIFLSACKKENDLDRKVESNLKFTESSPSSSEINSKPFTISYAGIWDKYLFLGLTYTGGRTGHEFYVTWNGEIREADAKKYIDLKVSHKNSDDNGTSIITDSLVLDIGTLNIPNELRNDKNLFFNVINTSNPLNVIVVPAVYIVDNGNNNNEPPVNPTQYKKEMQVVLQECDKGAWGGLWLKGLDSDTCFLPKAIESNISYTPMLNDKLKVTYETTWLADSTNICNFWQGKIVKIVNIKSLEKL